MMTRGLIMQKACRNPCGPRHLVGTRFQVYFTPLTGVLFTFPSRYLFTIGHRLVFSLGGWAPRIRTGFHVSRPTWDTARLEMEFRLRGYHPLWPTFPSCSSIQFLCHVAVPQPLEASFQV